MTLYLLPNTFYDDQPTEGLLPAGLSDILRSLYGIIGESERTTRRYLIKLLEGSDHARALPICLLNEHTSSREVVSLAHTIEKGENWGLLSDAGICCIADPGSALILTLHSLGFYEVTSIGCPSSLLMALQLSGLSGQQFVCHGYLPHEREKRLQLLRKSERDKGAQLCIETPYRNKALFQELLSTFHDQTLLCVAHEVGCPHQKVRTYPIASWKKKCVEIEKVPTVFLWQGELI